MVTRLKTLTRCMSINKHKAMASEFLLEQEAQQGIAKQAEQANDNELADQAQTTKPTSIGS